MQKPYKKVLLIFVSPENCSASELDDQRADGDALAAAKRHPSHGAKAGQHVTGTSAA